MKKQTLLRDKKGRFIKRPIIKNNWCTATTNIFTAIKDLISCSQAGYNCWLTKRKNQDCEYPIKIKNPQLNNIENWTTGCAYPRTKEELEKESFLMKQKNY